MKRTSIPKKRAKPRRGPLRDKKYLAFIAAQSCCVPGYHLMPPDQLCLVEVAHVGLRGLGQKCSDRETIPLCAWHHRIGQASVHVLGKNFWSEWGLDKDALIAKYNRMYEETTS